MLYCIEGVAMGYALHHFGRKDDATSEPSREMGQNEQILQYPIAQHLSSKNQSESGSGGSVPLPNPQKFKGGNENEKITSDIETIQNQHMNI